MLRDVVVYTVFVRAFLTTPVQRLFPVPMTSSLTGAEISVCAYGDFAAENSPLHSGDELHCPQLSPLASITFLNAATEPEHTDAESQATIDLTAIDRLLQAVHAPPTFRRRPCRKTPYIINLREDWWAKMLLDAVLGALTRR